MKETFEALSAAAKMKKMTWEQNKLGYLFLTMLGGIFVGFGMILLVTIGGLLDPVGAPSMKIIQGISFGVALSMVMLGGADLYTGNNLVMTVGALEKQTTWGDLGKVWVVSWIGNFIGSFVVAWLFFMAGLASGETGAYIEKIAGIKMNIPFTELLFRGILCNILVCMAVWSCYKVKNEAAKILLIFCCIYPFITAGFEHSVANMTLFSLALMIPHGELVSLSGLIHNLIPVSIGNAIGGAVFIGFAFWYSQVRK
ncbi:formate/nitrite transporter family protein [Lysinibacillus sp. KU-BSD001]|uniref:formate/nitrite transporter family protein n=1 Tax=Lysinibacillus sp. KU-BSD001 TaxID=3141328 RepID=UPI0036E0EA26